MSIRRGGLFLQYDENGEPYPVIDDEPDGAYVLYADHIAALEQQRIYLAQASVSSGGYAEGYAAGVQAAREAVAAAYARDSIAVRSQTEWGVEIALAAIDALR